MSFPAKLNAEADFLRPSPKAAESVANSFPSLFNESTMVMLSDASILKDFIAVTRSETAVASSTSPTFE